MDGSDFFICEHCGNLVGMAHDAAMPLCESVVTFALSEEKPVSVYVYCNLHGLWEKEI